MRNFYELMVATEVMSPPASEHAMAPHGPGVRANHSKSEIPMQLFRLY